MKVMNLAPARKAAFAALLAVERGAWSAEALAAKSEHLDSRDAGLASDIVFGVLRRRGELDALIRSYSKVPPEQIDPEIWIALEMAFYQLRFQDRVPAHAIVNDAVELSRRAGNDLAANFVNAILRQSLAEAGRDSRIALHACLAAGPLDNAIWRRSRAGHRARESHHSRTLHSRGECRTA